MHSLCVFTGEAPAFHRSSEVILILRLERYSKQHSKDWFSTLFDMYFLVSVDSNMAAYLASVLSAVSGYCMCCFSRKRKKKSDTAFAFRSGYIYNSMRITCIIIYIYDEYFGLNNVAMQNHWMFLKLVNLNSMCKLQFFYINMNFIKQNMHILCNMMSYECHLMKIIL
jgi:hypothetical protein